MAVAQPKIGLFAGIFNKEGKLLVKRRQLGESLAGEWDLPGGGVEADNNAKATDERIIGYELAREVREEVGLEISVKAMALPMYPAVIKGGNDWAFLIYIGEVTEKPKSGKIKWVSVADLNDLSNGSEGNRLVSGWGKRMHRLCLTAFLLYFNLNPKVLTILDEQQAYTTLDKIQANWEK